MNNVLTNEAAVKKYDGKLYKLEFFKWSDNLKLQHIQGKLLTNIWTQRYLKKC